MDARISGIVEDLTAQGATREQFIDAFPISFKAHHGRPFDFNDAHDLMLSEVAFSELYGWLADDGTVYR